MNSEEIEKQKVLVKQQIEMLEKSMEQHKEKYGEDSPVLADMEEELEDLNISLDMLNDGIFVPMTSKSESTQAIEAYAEFMGASSCQFKKITDVTKYLKANADTVMADYDKAGRKAFIDGAHWLFDIMFENEARLSKKISDLSKAILKRDETILEYEELYGDSSYTPTKKRGKKRRNYDDDDDYADGQDFNNLDSFLDEY